MQPGCIVQCRNREWVLLPSENDDVFLLRPLTGATDEVVAIHKRLTDLIGYSLPDERVRSATFLSQRLTTHLMRSVRTCCGKLHVFRCGKAPRLFAP
jgi:hypothetical protein